MLENFPKYWAGCKGDPEAEHRLTRTLIEWVYVEDNAVVALRLPTDCYIVLGNKTNGPTTISVDPSVYTSGDDGVRLRAYILLVTPYSFLDNPLNSTVI